MTISTKLKLNSNLFFKRTLLVFAFLLSMLLTHAQTRQISGTITSSEDNLGIPGVNILLQGTSQGTTTDVNGNYTLQLSNESAVLKLTAIGFEEQIVNVSEGMTSLNITMQPNVTQLSEIVVTALGIQRDEQSLGFSVQKINGEELEVSRDPNMLNNLSGRVAGVQINNGGSGLGSSARIVIRGESSLSGNNQPLFVVNGVPINNTTGGNGRQQGNLEADYGNGAAEINPNDIESISILKGASATALYGSRAANGVILISTKTGKDTKGIGLTFNSSTTFEKPLRIPQYQNKYGQGSGFQFDFVNGGGAGTADGVDESWGPALNGQPIVQHNSTNAEGVRAGDFLLRPSDYSDQGDFQALPFSPQPDNIESFFETGHTLSNNIAFSGNSETGNFRFSYNNMSAKGILPNTDLNRNSFSLDASQKFANDKLTLSTNVNYIQSGSTNRANNSYGTENIMYLWVWFGRHIDMNSLRNYWQPGYENVQQFNYNYNWHDNPFFTMYENTNSFTKDRMLGNIKANYQLNDHFDLMVRTGNDFYNELRAGKRAYSTQRFPKGQYREDHIYFNERNTDFLITYNNELSRGMLLNASFGGNNMKQTQRYLLQSANELVIPGIFSFKNSAIPVVVDPYNQGKIINSLYATTQLSINNAIYFDFAGRNDWASTLPSKNNSYFYPATSVAVVLGELMELPKNMNFGKLRLGYGEVGNDTNPFSIESYFQFKSTAFGSQALGNESNSLSNLELKPERAKTFEIGAELGFFENKLNMDITYFNTNTINQIIRIPVSQTSGFGSKIINAGNIQSKGLEVLLSANPVSTESFDWKTSVNFTRNRSYVREMTEGIDEYNLTGNYLSMIAKVDGRMGDVYGTGFVLIDENTGDQVVVDHVDDIKDNHKVLYNEGLPVRDPNLRNLGNYNPDWLMGISNDFVIKNTIRMGMLWDIRQGGVIMSRTLLIGGTSGMMAETAEFDRETHTYIGDGVKEGDTAGYVSNDVEVSARDYYWSHFNRGNEQMGMYDASFVKLRELRLGYMLPSSFLNKIGARSGSINLVGRNLLLFTENPHFDPEVFSYNSNNMVPGVEDMATPSTKSYGFNINLTF